MQRKAKARKRLRRGARRIPGVRRHLPDVDETGIQRHIEDQLGFVTHAQLKACHLVGMRLSRALKKGKLEELYPGVYHRGTWPLMFEQKCHGACLWLEGAVVSHTAAGRKHEFWGLDKDGDEVVEITAETSKRTRAPPGVTLHRTRDLPESDIVEEDGIRYTKPVRTLIDLAAVLDEEKLAFALEYAWKKGLTTPDEVRARLDQMRDSGVKGVKLLLRLLDDCDARGIAVDSPLEVRIGIWLRNEGITVFEAQHEFEDEHGDGRMDFGSSKYLLAIEAQGYFWHGTREDFEDDAERISRIVAQGYAVMTITWRMTEEDPGKVMRLIRRALKAREWVFERRLASAAPTPEASRAAAREPGRPPGQKPRRARGMAPADRCSAARP